MRCPRSPRFGAMVAAIPVLVSVAHAASTDTYLPGAPREPREPRQVRIGDTVRVWVQGAEAPLEGVLLRMTPARWELSGPDEEVRTWTPSSMRSIEVRTMRRRTKLLGLCGAVLGVGVGVAIARHSESGCEPGEDWGFCELEDDVEGFLTVVVTTSLGLAAGAAVGSRIESPRWVPAVAPPSPGEGSAARLSWEMRF